MGQATPVAWSPDVIAREPSLAQVTYPTGFGLDRMPWSDLGGPLIAQAAESASDGELLAQLVVLTWLQVQDHEDHNFMQDGNRVLAVDFASGPRDAVWEGVASLTEERPDHGRLRDRVARSTPEAKAETRRRLKAIDAEALDADLAEMPESWATPAERVRVRDELLRVKDGIIRDLLG